MGIQEISLTVQEEIKKRQVDGPVKGYTDGITLVVERDDRVAYLVEEQTVVPLRGEMEQLKLITFVWEVGIVQLKLEKLGRPGKVLTDSHSILPKYSVLLPRVAC